MARRAKRLAPRPLRGLRRPAKPAKKPVWKIAPELLELRLAEGTAWSEDRTMSEAIRSPGVAGWRRANGKQQAREIAQSAVESFVEREGMALANWARTAGGQGYELSARRSKQAGENGGFLLAMGGPSVRCALWFA